MSASKRCPECQAVNTASAQWCAQCFVPFGSVQGPPGGVSAGTVATHDSVGPASAPQHAPHPGPGTGTPGPSSAGSVHPRTSPSSSAVSDSEELSTDQISELLNTGRLERPQATKADSAPDESVPDGATWTCKTCEATNMLSVDVCRACGVSIFDGFGGADDTGPKLSLSDATAFALLPGAGHMKQGHGLLGFIILVAVATLWVFGVWLGISDSVGTGVFFVLVALGLLGVSVVDARTIASGGTKLILTPRILSMVFGAAIVGIMAVVWLRAIS